MQAHALSRFVRVSPFKMRPFADVVRGSKVDKALAWLKTCPEKRAMPLIKTIASAFANAKDKNSDANVTMADFVIAEIRVDQGPTVRYFKPGAMGRASVQRRRFSHVLVKVEKN